MGRSWLKYLFTRADDREVDPDELSIAVPEQESIEHVGPHLTERGRPTTVYARGMSKVDAQRAMREARYAAYRASLVAADDPDKGSPPSPAPVPLPKPSDVPEARDAAAVGEAAVVALTIQARVETPADTRAWAAPQVALSAPAEPATLVLSADPNGEPELCGHRNIGNKSCQRPTGHSEKSHRYK